MSNAMRCPHGVHFNDPCATCSVTDLKRDLDKAHAALKIARHALTGQWAPVIVNGEQATGLIQPQYAISVIDAALGTKPCVPVL